MDEKILNSTSRGLDENSKNVLELADGITASYYRNYPDKNVKIC